MKNSSTSTRKKKAAPCTGRPSRKAQFDGASYKEIFPHLFYLSTRFINEGKAIRVAMRALEQELGELERSNLC